MQPESHQPPLVVSAVGARIGIDVSALSTTGRDAVLAAWADALVTEKSCAQATVRATPTANESQSLSDLSGAVTRAAIETRRGELWMLHAAGLAACDGGVVILVGESGAGKTTATRVLARSYGYVSDETIGIEDDGRVHPYLKPLSVITHGERFKLQHPPRSLGLLPLPDTRLYIRRIVLLDRDPDTPSARLSSVPLAEALVALSGQSSALAAMPAPLRTMTSLIRRTGGVLRASYAEALSLETLLDEIFAGQAHVEDDPEPQEVTVSEPPPHPTPDAIDVRYRRRSDVIDWCALPNDQIAVLTSEIDGRGTLRVLGALASALWCASDGTSRSQLQAGWPDLDVEARNAIDYTLSQLVDAGLLTIDM